MLGDRFAVACVVVLAIDTLLFAVMGFLFVVCSVAHPEQAQALAFAHSAKDRPVLETVHQVWDARVTGVSEFDFDGVHYIVENLPKGYVDYSAWYVRLP